MKLGASTSPKKKLNEIDWLKVGRGFLITMAGSGLAYIGATIKNIDFGIYQAIAIPALGGIVELLRRYLTDYSK